MFAEEVGLPSMLDWSSLVLFKDKSVSFPAVGLMQQLSSSVALRAHWLTR